MEMTHYFESLGKRLDDSIATVRTAADEDRHQLEQRLDTAQADARRALDQTEQKTSKAADDAGISGTPAFVINGYFINGAQPYPKFKKLIEKALDEANK